MIAAAPFAAFRSIDVGKPAALGPSRLIDHMHARGVMLPNTAKRVVSAPSCAPSLAVGANIAAATVPSSCDGFFGDAARLPKHHPLLTEADLRGEDLVHSHGFALQHGLAVPHPTSTCAHGARKRRLDSSDNLDHGLQAAPADDFLGFREFRAGGSSSSASEARSRSGSDHGVKPTVSNTVSRASSSTDNTEGNAVTVLKERNKGLRAKLKEAMVIIEKLKAQNQDLQMKLQNAKTQRSEADLLALQDLKLENEDLQSKVECAESAKAEAGLIIARFEAETASLREELRLLQAAQVSFEDGHRMIAATPTPGKAGAKTKLQRTPNGKQRPAVPAFSPQPQIRPPQLEPAMKLHQMKLPPKKPEDNIDIPDHKIEEDEEDDDFIIEKDLDMEDMGPIPKWCENHLECLAAQSHLDPDTIFGSKVPACDLDVIFPDKLYLESGAPRVKRRRGSSGEWGHDRLDRDENSKYKKIMGQTESWDSVSVKLPIACKKLT